MSDLFQGLDASDAGDGPGAGAAAGPCCSSAAWPSPGLLGAGLPGAGRQRPWRPPRVLRAGRVPRPECPSPSLSAGPTPGLTPGGRAGGRGRPRPAATRSPRCTSCPAPPPAAPAPAAGPAAAAPRPVRGATAPPRPARRPAAPAPTGPASPAAPEPAPVSLSASTPGRPRRGRPPSWSGRSARRSCWRSASARPASWPVLDWTAGTDGAPAGVLLQVGAATPLRVAVGQTVKVL